MSISMSEEELARRIAQSKAEALERYSRILTEEWINNGDSYGLCVASGQALLQAKEYRRQAEACYLKSIERGEES